MKHAKPRDVIQPPTVDRAPYDQETLERRLDDGYRRIEEARVQGRDVQAWEEFWIQLLREYEEICDGLRLAAA
jgi:hypothetical protein